MQYILLICSTFTVFCSTTIASEKFDNRQQDYSDAEIAIIELPPPSDSKQRSQSNKASQSTFNFQDAAISSFFADEKDNEQESEPRPFTITFPLSKGLSNRQSVQSIVIPLPANLDDKTGIIVIEDHSDGEFLDQRTLRAQFFSPSRINSAVRSQPLLRKNESDNNQSEFTTIQLVSLNKTLKSSQRQNPRSTSKRILKEIAVPSTISTVIFDDDESQTSTFSPETVFRPKVSIVQKKKLPIVSRKKISANNVVVNLRAKQPLIRKPITTTVTTPPPTTTPIPTTTTTITTTTQPTTILLELEKITEKTTETPPETLSTTLPKSTTTVFTTRRKPNIRHTISINGRPSIRRSTFQTTTTTTTTVKPTTTTTIAPTTTSPPIFVEFDYDTILPEISFESDNVKNRSIDPVKNKTSTVRTVDGPRPPGVPNIPGNFGFLPSGKAFNIPQNVPGSAGEDYPIYDKIPITKFDCREHIYPGFYSDLDTGCQVYHSCNGKMRASKHSFLCPNGTIFSQEYLICDWWYNVKCEDSPTYYPLNKEAFSAEPKNVNNNNNNNNNNANNANTNDKRNKQTTTEFVIRTITTTDLP